MKYNLQQAKQKAISKTQPTTGQYNAIV